MTKVPSFDEIANAHGHICPGIAIGYKIAVVAAKWAGEEENIKLFSTSTRCPLDALKTTFHLREHPERLTIDDKNSLHFILEKPDGSKFYIDEVPGSKIKSDEGDLLREKIHNGTASEDEKLRFNQIQKELLELTFDTPNEKIFTTHT